MVGQYEQAGQLAAADIETSEKLAEFPLSDGGCVIVACEDIGLGERIISYRAYRFSVHGFATEASAWRDTAALAMADGLQMAGWASAVVAR